LRYLNQKEERMTKFRLIGVAAVLSSVLAAPAMARHVIAHPGHYALSTYCATIEPGNPYSPMFDYLAWSGWRARGGWDSRGDDACARNPMFSGGSIF
jgi:hypothetical protein